MKHWTFNTGQHFGKVKAKFHYTGPTGPDQTRPDFVGDPRGPNGISRRPGPQKKFVRVHAGPVGPV